jgi:hypothetical protein
MTITLVAKAWVGNALVAAMTASASGDTAARVHPDQENPVAALRENSGIDPAVGHPLPATGARSNARTVGIRRQAKPVRMAKVRNAISNIGPCPRQSRYRLSPKRNVSQRC